MNRFYTSVVCALLSATLLNCSSKKEDTPPTSLPGTEVTGAPTAPAGAANVSQVQVRVTGVGLDTLRSKVIIDAHTVYGNAPIPLNFYTKNFHNATVNEVFNVGTMAENLPNGVRYVYNADVVIINHNNFSALPSNLDMKVEILKNGNVVAASHSPTADRPTIVSSWQQGPDGIHSTVNYIGQ